MVFRGDSRWLIILMVIMDVGPYPWNTFIQEASYKSPGLFQIAITTQFFRRRSSDEFLAGLASNGLAVLF